MLHEMDKDRRCSRQVLCQHITQIIKGVTKMRFSAKGISSQKKISGVMRWKGSHLHLEKMTMILHEKTRQAQILADAEMTTHPSDVKEGKIERIAIATTVKS